MDPCVKAILCALSPPVISALQALIAPYRVLVSGWIVAIEAQLAIIDLWLVPFYAGQAAAQAVLDASRATARLLPVTLIAGCAELGDLNMSVEKVIAPTVADVQAWLAEMQRYVSLREELAALREEYQALEAFLDELLNELEGCDEL